MIGRAARANFAGHSHSILNYAFAHDQFGLALAFQERLGESLSEGKLASETRSPFSANSNRQYFCLCVAGQVPGREGADQKGAADLDPAYFFPQMAYGWIDIEAGKTRDAIPDLLRAKAMESPAFVTAFLA